jgi:hypothetical protein
MGNKWRSLMRKTSFLWEPDAGEFEFLAEFAENPRFKRALEGVWHLVRSRSHLFTSSLKSHSSCSSTLATVSLLFGIMAVTSLAGGRSDLVQTFNQTIRTDIGNFELTHDEQVVAAILVMEAGGEGKEEMWRVMNVIANRAGGNPLRFGDIVRNRHAFDAYTRAGRDDNSLIAVAQDARHVGAWVTACGIVHRASTEIESFPDLTKGAFYYVTKAGSHAWAASLPVVSSSAKQVFLGAGVDDVLAKNAKMYAEEWAVLKNGLAKE